jgi:hypothetical protein
MTPDLVFDVTQSADAFSALAGIIAGFAFATLVWLVERIDPEDSAPDAMNSRGLVLLGISFLGNVLIAFLYAIISGQTHPEAGRTDTLSFIAGSGFSLLTVLTIEALVFVVAATNIPWIAELFRRIFSFTVVIAAIFQWSSALALLFGTVVVENLQAHVVGLGLYSGGSAILLGAGLAIGNLKPERRYGLISRGGFNILIWLVLYYTLALACIYAYVANGPIDRAFSTRTIGIAMLAWSLLVGWACVFMPRPAHNTK